MEPPCLLAPCSLDTYKRSRLRSSDSLSLLSTSRLQAAHPQGQCREREEGQTSGGLWHRIFLGCLLTSWFLRVDSQAVGSAPCLSPVLHISFSWVKYLLWFSVPTSGSLGQAEQKRLLQIWDPQCCPASSFQSPFQDALVLKRVPLLALQEVEQGAGCEEEAWTKGEMGCRRCCRGQGKSNKEGGWAQSWRAFRGLEGEGQEGMDTLEFPATPGPIVSHLLPYPPASPPAWPHLCLVVASTSMGKGIPSYLTQAKLVSQSGYFFRWSGEKQEFDYVCFSFGQARLWSI